MSDLIINVDTEKIIKQNHIAWYIVDSKLTGSYFLYEVVERLYIHPDSQGNALIPNIESVCVECFSKTEPRDKLAHIYQLFDANNNITEIQRLKQKLEE